jgi:hypothetical protein
MRRAVVAKPRDTPLEAAPILHQRDFQNLDPLPCPRQQKRRLQEGSDVGDATVAGPKWTGLSPMEDSVGKHDALNRGSGAQGHRRRQGFRPRKPQHNAKRGPRDKSKLPLPPPP